MIRIAAALALFLAVSISYAQETDVSVLIQRGGATGCDVQPDPSMAIIGGVTERITATVDSASLTVSAVTLESCSGGGFGAASNIGGGYPAGLNNGISGADVVEVSVPAGSVLGGGGGSLNASFLADDGDSLDFAAGGFLGVTFPVPISPWAALVLALLLGLAGAWTLKRHRGAAALMLGLVAFAVWAANFIADGDVSDWAGVAPRADAVGDATLGGNRADIVATFVAEEGGRLFFRIDLADIENAAPVAVNDAFATDEDSNFTTGNVLANDTDPEDNPLTISSTNTTGAQGTVTDNGDGTFGYDPNGQFETLAQGASTTDSFGYTVSDGQGGTATGTVTITISGVNDAPVANADNVSTAEDTPVSGNVLSNDSDIDSGDTLTAGTTPISGPSNGSLTLNADGSFAYTPNLNFVGSDSFGYQITDGSGATDTANVTINVGAVNDMPVANADTGATDEDTVLNVVAPGVLGNDTDPEGDALSVSASDAASAQGAAVTINADGSYSYDPTAAAALQALDDGEQLIDSFAYTASDGAFLSSTTVSITVSGVNDAPVARADAITTDEDTVLNGNVLNDNGSGADSDIDNEPLSISSVNGSTAQVGSPISTTAGAALQLNADGSFSYEPAGAFDSLTDGQQASDSFTYAITDGTASSNTVTVTITINGINDATLVTFPTAGANYQSSLGAANIDPAATVTDADSADFDTGDFAASVTLTATPTACDPLDTLLIENQGAGAGQIGFDGTNVSYESTVIGTLLSPCACVDAGGGSFDLTPLVIDFNASATATAVQALTRALQFDTTSADDQDRTATVIVSDGDGASSVPVSQNLSLSFNNPPVAVDDGFATDEDSPITTGSVLTNDTDADFDPLTVSSIDTTATQGTVMDNSDGTFDYDPAGAFESLAQDAMGSDSFTYTVADGNGGSDTGTVAIDITGVNDSPIAGLDEFSTEEDTPLSDTVLTNDFDPDTGDTLTVSTTPVSGPTNGLLILTADGSFTYSPNADFNGSDGFQYQLNDNNGGSATGTVTLTVGAVNDEPAADPQSVSTDEDMALLITLTGSDVDGDSLTFSIASGPTNGTLGAITPIDATSAEVTYTPNTDFNGADSFTFTANDGTVSSAAASVSITVNAVNDAPMADAQSVMTDEDVAVLITLTGSDVEGSSLTFAIATGPSNGLLGAITPVDATSAQVTYTPGADFTGVDSFDFTVDDGTLPSAVASVSISVGGVNDAPVVDLDADDSAGTAGSGYTLAYTENDGPQLLADIDATITDVDSATLTQVTLTLSNQIDGGEESLAADATGFPGITVQAFDTTTIPGSGILVFSAGTPQPIADFQAVLRTATYQHNGDDPDTTDRTITVTADDGSGDGPAATSAVQITAVDDAPTADAQMVSTDEDTPLVVTLTGSDVEGDSLNFAIGTGPSNGSLSAITPIDATSAEVTYTPDADFNGADSYTFTVNDGTSTSAAATVSVTVDPITDAPTANAQAASTDEDVAVVITLTGTDVDGDSLTFAVDTGPSNGTLGAITPIDATSAQVTYTPDADYSGADSFTFTVNDGTTTSAAATVAITIDVVNDPPVADGQAVTSDEDAPVVITLTGSDPENDSLTFSIAVGPANGTLGAITSTGATSAQVTFTPNADFNGTDGFTFNANDGTVNSVSPATVSLTIDAVNDAPVASDQAVSLNEDGSLLITLTGSDVDAGDTLTFALDTGPGNGALSGFDAATGEVTYTPNANFNGADSFTFTTNDGTTSSAAGTLSITVNPVNDPPAANAQTVVTDEDVPLVVTLTGSDIDGDALTFAIGAGPSNGSLSAITPIDATSAQVTYTPNTDYIGSDSFSFTVSDGAVTSAAATVSITVNPVNDPPVAGSDSFEAFGNTELRVDLLAASTPHLLQNTIGASGVLNNDSDPVEGSAVSFSGVVGCADATAPFDCATAGGGQVIVESDGSFSYRPPQGLRGFDSVQYTITDAEGASATGTVNFTTSEMVWYVDPDAAAGGDGRSHSPLQNLAALNGAGGAGDLDGSADTVFVHDGIFSGSIELEAFQQLIGEGAGLSLHGTLGTVQLVPTGIAPRISNGAGDVVRIGSAIPVRVAGLSLDGGANAIDLTTSAGLTGSISLTIENNTFRGAGAEGIDVNLNAGTTGDFRLNISGNTWDAFGMHMGNAIDVSRTAGIVDLDVSFNDNVLSTGGNAIVVSSNVRGGIVVSDFDRNSVHGDTAGAGVVMSNAVFDWQPLTAGIQEVSTLDFPIGDSGNPVGGAGMVLNNVEGSLRFSDLDIFAGGSGLTASGAGSGFSLAVSPATSVFQAANGAAVDLNSVAIDLQLADMDSTTTGAGVSLVGVGGTFSVGAGASISKSSGGGTAFAVSNSVSGTNISYGGTINVSSGGGVALTNNSGSTVDFSGGMVLNTGVNAGFTATGGGNVTATGAGSTVTTTTGTAVNIANTTIGASDLTFQAISAGTSGNPANGIVLNNTGALGELIVTGTGGTCTSAASCTGGAIQNTTGDGISLTSTRAPSLTRLFVGGSGRHGIHAANLSNGLALANSYVQNSGNADNEYGLNVSNVAGAVTISGTTFDNAADDLVHYVNLDTDGTLTVDGASSFLYPSVVGGTANAAIALQPNGTSNLTATIQNNTFTNIVSSSVQWGAATAASSGTSTLNFSDNVITVDTAARGSGFQLSCQESTTGNITIANNDFSGAGGNGVISIDCNDSSLLSGTVSGNVISNPPGIGMFVAVDEAAEARLTVSGNTITNSGGDGIQVVNFGGVGISDLFLAITNNQVNGHSLNTGVNFVGGVSVTSFEDSACIELTGNSVTGTPGGATHCGGLPCVDYYIEEVGGTTMFEEVPDTADTTLNGAYVNANNDAGPVTIFGSIDLTNGAQCAFP